MLVIIHNDFIIIIIMKGVGNVKISFRRKYIFFTRMCKVICSILNVLKQVFGLLSAITSFIFWVIRIVIMFS